MIDSKISIEACAKVNLRLAVLERLASGYHSLETIFCGISLADTITVERSEGPLELVVEGGIATGPAEENLVARAARAFFDDAGVVDRVRLTLAKRIPVQAGLGGGSADAGATLRLLNEAHDRPLSEHRLLHLAAQLGSDVPFFLSATPFALAWGRGERLLELPPLPGRPVVIAHPGTGIPTPAAFARLSAMRDGAGQTGPATLPLEALGSWDGVTALAGNDFEFVAFERIPPLVHAVRAMVDSGADLAQLTGSGAAIFGVFPDDAGADRAHDLLRRMGLECWRARTLERWPHPGPSIDPRPVNG